MCNIQTVKVALVTSMNVKELTIVFESLDDSSRQFSSETDGRMVHFITQDQISLHTDA